MPLAPLRAAFRADVDPRRRRLLGALVSAPVTLAGGLTACREKTAAPTDDHILLSVFWWGDQRRAELTERALNLYSAKHRTVTFRVTWQGRAGYYDHLSTQAAAGNVPDLFQIDDDYLTEYAERQILLDLTESVQDNRLDLRGVPQSLMQYGQSGGRTVAVPAAADTPALVYNRSLVQRLGLAEPTIGMSYQQLIDWAVAVTQQSKGQVAGTMDAAADYRALWLWLRGRDKEFYQGHELGFGTADLAAWFDLWQDARARKATPGVAVVQRANTGEVAQQPVVTGQAATSFIWSEQLPQLQRLTKDELNLVSCPGNPAAHWSRASMCWAGFRGTRHPEAVVDVINFLTNSGEAGRTLGTDRGMNANLDIRHIVQDSLTDPVLRRSAAFEATMYGRFGSAPALPPKGHPTVRALLVTAAETNQQGRAASRTAADRFIREANAALAG